MSAHSNIRRDGCRTMAKSQPPKTQGNIPVELLLTRYVYHRPKTANATQRLLGDPSQPLSFETALPLILATPRNLPTRPTCSFFVFPSLHTIKVAVPAPRPAHHLQDEASQFIVSPATSFVRLRWPPTRPTFSEPPVEAPDEQGISVFLQPARKSLQGVPPLPATFEDKQQHHSHKLATAPRLSPISNNQN